MKTVHCALPLGDLCDWVLGSGWPVWDGRIQAEKHTWFVWTTVQYERLLMQSYSVLLCLSDWYESEWMSRGDCGAVKIESAAYGWQELAWRLGGYSWMFIDFENKKLVLEAIFSYLYQPRLFALLLLKTWLRLPFPNILPYSTPNMQHFGPSLSSHRSC